RPRCRRRGSGLRRAAPRPMARPPPAPAPGTGREGRWRQRRSLSWRISLRKWQGPESRCSRFGPLLSFNDRLRDATRVDDVVPPRRDLPAPHELLPKLPAGLRTGIELPDPELHPALVAAATQERVVQVAHVLRVAAAAEAVLGAMDELD